VLKSGFIENENASINISRLPAGQYYFKLVNTTNSQSVTKKIIKYE
jgi:hypothetical protein